MSSLASGLAPAEGRAPWRRRWARAIRRAIIRRPDSSVSARSAACDPWSGVFCILSARIAGWSHRSRGGPAGEYTARAAQTWPHSSSCASVLGARLPGGTAPEGVHTRTLPHSGWAGSPHATARGTARLSSQEPGHHRIVCMASTRTCRPGGRVTSTRRGTKPGALPRRAAPPRHRGSGLREERAGPP